MGVLRGKIGEGVVRYWLVLTFRGSYVCANFCENRSRNAIVRVLEDGQTDRQTDAYRFYNLSLAICYSYWTDKNVYTVNSPTGKTCTWWSKHTHTY